MLCRRILLLRGTVKLLGLAKENIVAAAETNFASEAHGQPSHKLDLHGVGDAGIMALHFWKFHGSLIGESDLAPPPILSETVL